MTDRFLIAHKVRGEPAFDIAERCDIAGEEAWIIPTSGHRAYPYWHTEFNMAEHLSIQMPSNLRDHYEVSKPSREPSAVGTSRPKVTEIDLNELDL